MKRGAAYSLNLLAVAILAVTGQSILLAPDHQSLLLADLSDPIRLALGAAMILVDLHCVNAILIGRQSRSLRLANLLSAIAFAGLGVLYFRAGLFIETGLLGAICAGQLALLAENLRGRPLLAEPLFVVCAVSSLIGAGWLAISRIAPAGGEVLEEPQTLAMTAAFLIAAGTSAYAAFARPGTRSRILGKLGLVAWLMWPILFHQPGSGLAGWIPSLCLALVLALSGWLPWERLALPPGNQLGRRFSIAISSVSFLVLASLTAIVRLGGSESAMLLDDLTFGLSLTIAFLMALVLATVSLTINGLLAVLDVPDSREPQAEESRQAAHAPPTGVLARLLEPFSASHQELRTRTRMQADQLVSLQRQLETEQRRRAQMALLIELDQQLENQLDPPVSAQLTVSTLQRALGCHMAAILMHEAERREFVALATAAHTPALMPPGYRQNHQQGLIGRAARLRKTQVVNDTRLDADYINLEQQAFLSEVVVPLIHHGHLQGVLVVDDERARAFLQPEVEIIETAAAILLRGWERSNHAQRLTDLIQAGITLTSAPDPHTAIREIAEIARHTLQANFVFVTLLDQDQNLTRTAAAGYAPSLVRSLNQNPRDDNLIQTTLNAGQPIRVRDIRKYRQAAHLRVDHDGLRSLLAIPIRLRRLTIGVILAFGKHSELAFSESDESLARLMASQAGAAIESAWLVQQLRNTVKITTLLHELSTHIIQSEAPGEAARAIAEKTFQWTGAASAGIVLFTPERKIEAEVAIDENGPRTGTGHPFEMIQQAMETGQSLFVSRDDGRLRICYPLFTPRRQYGALWLEVAEEEKQGTRFSTDLQTVCNQAAIALERSILLRETRNQALALEAAYQELELTYDQTLAALMAALDARDRETEGHSTRVSRLACVLGDALGLTQTQLKTLERGSLLHDIGKIGISDTILHKPGPLTEEEWAIMRLHPDIGARIVEDIPFLRETLPVIRHHQERWDGSGYPQGMRGPAIPLEARIFAVADAFDALTSTRPYRDKISFNEALEYLHQNAGVLFDPQIVNALAELGGQRKLDFMLDLT